jgi:uncharacterized protein YbjT (DUF2867 family)
VSGRIAGSGRRAPGVLHHTSVGRPDRPACGAPGGLLDKAVQGQAFLTADTRSFSWIRRADLAQLVVRALDDPATTGRVYHAHDPQRTRFWVLPFN